MIHASTSLPDDETLRGLLRQARSIAVVGISPNPLRPSHEVAAYLQRAGYRIIPVNPSCQEVLGERCHGSLAEIDEPVDIVDCFRRSEEIPPIARAAVALGARALWMQLGVHHEEAAKIAADAGLLVISNRCLKIEHARLR
ncbi:MAG: CoA-binding protein [Betaproteobacteria bacterium]|jgi:predicted CoA-binding protein|nr:CoA-binding protein [Betaproteobacteria bacterium]